MPKTAIPPGLRWATLIAGTLTLSLAGCAGTFRVESRVESFARWSAPQNSPAETAVPVTVPAPPQAYRFERLPSQTSGPAAQSQTELESLVESEMVPLGWTRASNPALARWTVQVNADHQRLPRAPWEDPWDNGYWGWSTRVSIGLGHGQIFWRPGFPRADVPYHLRRVGLVIRDARQGQVVFETSAAHDGRWNSTPALWRAMISAALRDFPTPPTGQREIPIDVPR